MLKKHSGTFLSRKSFFQISLAIVLTGVAGLFAAPPTSLNSSGWKLKPQAEVTITGQQLSSATYNAASWVNAVVPGTVFGSYAAAGLERDPNFGDNIYNVDKTKYDRNYWYRSNFTVPSSYNNGKIFLNFDGVNRDADIYVNGTYLGNVRGYMARGNFDITNLVTVGGTNGIAVLVYVPAFPVTNSASPTFICSQGWDWMPRVPGFNMGIYNDVYLSNTGSVRLVDPWIRTALPSNSTANVSIQLGLNNRASGTVTGTLTGTINPGNITFSRSVTVGASSTTTVTLDNSSFSQLTINNPDLWWPNGYGTPNIYTCNLKFQINGIDSDTKEISFGIKKYGYDSTGGVLKFLVNGVRVFVKGGNWGMSEYLLRCQGDEYDTKVRYHKEMNFNMIRNWTGETPDDEFYAACDKYGIMVWDDFALDTWWGSRINLHPADTVLFRMNAIEKIKRFRNHPCIALWCGQNEGVPIEPLNSGLRSSVQLYDGSDRLYQPSSNTGNLSGSGKWTNDDPKNYFTGIWVYNSNWGMRSELGTAVFPQLESFRKFMPSANLWPRNSMWDKHFFGTSAPNAGPDKYDATVNERYGTATGIEDYCMKAQMVNYETNKAMFEGWTDNMWADASGILIWMSQSAYPSMVWQTYDYYYDLTGAYWGAKKGCEPLHIQWSYNNDWIRVINTTNQTTPALRAEAWIYNLDGTQKYYNTTTITSTTNTTTNCFQLAFPTDLTATHFIRLKLTNSNNVAVSENFYWRGTTHLDFTALNSLNYVNLGVTSTTTTSNGNIFIDATITNPANSGAVALAIYPKVVNSRTGATVLPVFTNDGYFALIPGESKTVRLEFASSLLGTDAANVAVDCWNNYPHKLNLARSKPVEISSTDGYGGPASSITDGNLSTRWSSAWSDPQTVTIDLGQSTFFNRIRLHWETAYGKSYSIQISNDKTTWSAPIYTTTTGNGNLDDITNLNATARYVRLTGTVRATTYGYSLWEFEIFGNQEIDYAPSFDPQASYKLISQASGKALDNAGSSTNGSFITQWSDLGNANQKWSIVSAGGGYFKLISKGSGKALDNGGTTTDGAKMTQWTDIGNTNQQWKIVGFGNGVYKLICRSSGKSLDNTGSSTNGTAVTQWADLGNTNQKWIISKVN
jgi:hypothetical protein